MSVEPRARQLFFQFSPPLLYMAPTYPRAARGGGVRFIRPVCVFGVQTMLDTEIIHVCIRVSTQIIYVFGVQTILYTEIGASRKNFTAVKTVDVCAVGRVQVWEQPLKGQLLQSGPSSCLLIIIPSIPLHTLSVHIHLTEVNIYMNISTRTHNL